MTFFNGKNVLVTGGTGLIGRPLIKLLVEAGANLTVASLDPADDLPETVLFKRTDLREFSACIAVCENQEIVFQLAGVKGSPAMTSQRPASFFVPTLQFSINMMEAARQRGVERFLFTSSVGVYAPSELFKEDDVWSTFPSENDRFAGWAKRMGELQAQAYAIEYGWKNISIVRPANVYGPFDNFDPDNAMVIPSLIRRVVDGENPLRVWGDGSAIRDFIFSQDVARGMMFAVENGINFPVNLGSGTGISIKTIVEAIVKIQNNPDLEIVWDASKPNGDACRIMDTTRATSFGFKFEKSLEDGIRETMQWYSDNRSVAGNRYNAFTDSAYTQPK
jgi:GDP-L-fucose synthase